MCAKHLQHNNRESERLRIEAQNPNPKMPMVRYIGGTWRVGGLLALSRAFGDSYLKVCCCVGFNVALFKNIRIRVLGAGVCWRSAAGGELATSPYTLSHADTHLCVPSCHSFSSHSLSCLTYLLSL